MTEHTIQKEAWMEIDCPECGIDYDLSLDAIACPLGHVLTAETLAGANHYYANGEFMSLPAIADSRSTAAA